MVFSVVFEFFKGYVNIYNTFFNEHFNHHLILNTHNQLMRINMIYNTQGNFYQNNYLILVYWCLYNNCMVIITISYDQNILTRFILTELYRSYEY